LIEAVKTIYGKFGAKEIDDETVSRLLGHSTSRSGAYKQKLADLRSFRLIDPRGNVRITERGRKVTYPNNQKEEQDGLVEAISEIELWKLIYDKYTKKGLSLPSDFWTDIREWTGLPPEEAEKQVETTRKLYFDDIKYIKPETEVEKMTERKTGDKIDASKATSVVSLEEQADLVSGLIKFGAYDIAKQFIDFIKAKDSKKEEPKKETK
jgi:hypothetical protein